MYSRATTSAIAERPVDFPPDLPVAAVFDFGAIADL